MYYNKEVGKLGSKFELGSGLRHEVLEFGIYGKAIFFLSTLAKSKPGPRYQFVK